MSQSLEAGLIIGGLLIVSLVAVASYMMGYVDGLRDAGKFGRAPQKEEP